MVKLSTLAYERIFQKIEYARYVSWTLAYYYTVV